MVLSRLYVETRDERAESLLTQSITAHPKNALLLHTRAQWLEWKYDLRLRLALMYLDGQRPDLARQTLSQVSVEKCQEATLIQRAVSAAQQLDMPDEAAAFAERLVRLQPDERAHWISWTNLLVQSGDESVLHSALREMRARAAAWKLSESVQDTLRRHLAASCWRGVSRVLADPEGSLDGAWLCLSELEQTEHDPKRRLWAAWVRGTLAMREGNETALAEAREALKTQADWLDFPDGLCFHYQRLGGFWKCRLQQLRLCH